MPASLHVFPILLSSIIFLIFFDPSFEIAFDESNKAGRFVYELRNLEPNLLEENFLSQDKKHSLDEFDVGYKVIQIEREPAIRACYEHFPNEPNNFFKSMDLKKSEKDIPEIRITPSLSSISWLVFGVENSRRRKCVFLVWFMQS